MVLLIQLEVKFHPAIKKKYTLIRITVVRGVTKIIIYCQINLIGKTDLIIKKKKYSPQI